MSKINFSKLTKQQKKENNEALLALNKLLYLEIFFNKIAITSPNH